MLNEMATLPTTKSICCRLCASTGISANLINVYNDTESELASRINMHLPVTVAMDDTLPLFCCTRCANTVTDFHELVLRCLETDSQLRELSLRQQLKPAHQNDSLDDHTYVDIDVRNCAVENGKCDSVLNADDTTLEGIGLDVREVTTATINIEAVAAVQTSDGVDITALARCEVYGVACRNEEEFVEYEVVQQLRPANEAKGLAAGSRRDREALAAAKVSVNGKVYYQCQQCGKNLCSSYTFLWHMRIHTGERPHVCDLCGKQFRVAQGLIRHLRETHEGIKKFPCDLCGRMFATRRNVAEHRNTHTDERPYVCARCGKRFKQKASLFVHGRSHTDVRPFACTQCARAFRTGAALLAHVRRHTGEKPFACGQCGRAFRVKYELKRHCLIHSDEKPFECGRCHLTFRQKRYLANHSRLSHADGQAAAEARRPPS